MAKDSWIRRTAAKGASKLVQAFNLDEIKLPQGYNSLRSFRMGAGGVQGIREKGISFGGDGIGSADPLAIYRPGGGKVVDAAKAMASNEGWVFTANQAIGDELKVQEFKLYALDDEGVPEEKAEHDLLDLLDSVNDHQTGPEFKSTIGQQLELAGNCYILMEGVKDENEQPIALHFLNPGNVRILYDKTIYPWQIIGYEFRHDGRKYIYKPYQIIHIKKVNPNDPYEGIGTVQAIAAWIDLHHYAVEFNRQYFVRGVRLGLFIESEATDEAAVDRLRDSIDANHAGAENAHKVTVAPKGTKITDSIKSKDVEFSALFDMTRDMILAGFRVSKTILGTAESDTNRATAETADYVFSKRKIKPLMLDICSGLNEFLTYRYGDNLYLSFLDPTPEDRAARIDEQYKSTGGQAVISINEAREKYHGLGPIDGGDSVMIANNLTSVGAPNDESHPGQVGEGAKTARRRITQHAKNAKKRKAMSEHLADDIVKALSEIKSKSISSLTKDEYGMIWQKLDDRMRSAEADLRESIKKFNADQCAEVLDTAHQFFDEKGVLIPAAQKVNMDEIFDKKKWVKILTDLASPTLYALAEEESANAAGMFDKPGIHLDEDLAAKAALDARIALMADSYNQTTLDQLNEQITAGLAQNNGYAATAELIQGVYGYADETRSLLVSRTETVAVANASTKQTWKQIGVKTIKWITAEDGDVCPFCQEQDGKVISVDDNFYDQGDTITLDDGSTMTLDYSDVGAPPLHPNCRCYQRPEDVGGIE